MAVSASEPGQPHWRDIVPERQDASIESVSFGRATIAVTYLKNASTVIEVFDAAGRPVGTIKPAGHRRRDHQRGRGPAEACT